VIQIVRERQFKKDDRAVFVFTDPPVLIPTLGQLFKQHEQILQKHVSEDERWNLFYTLAHHAGAQSASKPQRTKSTFEYQSVLPFDIDVADTERPLEYATVIGKVIEAPLETLTVIVSGNGIHVLVNLRDPIRSVNYFPEKRGAYSRVCEMLNERFAQLRLPGHADPSVWDPARVLRMPGTINKKPGKLEKQCRLIQYSEAALSIDLFAISGFKAAEKENVSPAEIRSKYPTPDFREMVKECEFVKWSLSHVDQVHEPHAFDLFSILAPQPKDAQASTPVGNVTPRELAEWVFNNAKASDSLKKQDFEAKWNQSRTYGGRKCETIGSHWVGGCERCPHFGKIPTPLALKSPEHIGSAVNGYWVLNQKGQHQHPHYEDLAKVYRGETQYIVTPTGRLFVFGGTHYVENPTLLVKAWVEKKVRPTEPLRENHRNEFLHKIEALGGVTFEEETDLFIDSISGKINVQNGILDVVKGKLVPHDPKYGFKYVLPYGYTEGLNSEFFLDWLATVTQDRVELMDALLDVLAYCLWPNYDDHLFTYFVGEGANGKSTLLDVLRALVGKSNYAGVSLQQLGSNRFAAASLEGKLVNISGESSDHEMSVAEMNVIKELSSGEVTQIERKGQDLFSFKNQAKLVFSANKPPKFQEHGHALKRRLLVIPFDYKIANPDSKVSDRLIEEVPAIMSMLVRRIQDNVARHHGRFVVYRGGGPGEQAQHRILAQGNSVVDWAKDHVFSSASLEEEQWITVEDAYAQYRNWIQENGFKHFKNKIWFGKDMVDFVITPAAGKSSIIKKDGKAFRVYRRTRFKGAEECAND
jgi:P4 family phage/plasmid primase-like protien